MRALARPNPALDYDPDVEIDRLIAYRDRDHEDPDRNRHIPAAGQQGRILIATWNIANLGVHRRRQRDIEVIAAIISWFEIVAIQEVADNLTDFLRVVAALPDHFAYVFNDRDGSARRLQRFQVKRNGKKVIPY